MHSLHVLLCFIQLIHIVVTEWEIPINISYQFLRVITGYPTFIEFYYPPVQNLTGNDDELSSIRRTPILSKKFLSWSICDLFPGDDHTCTSTITAERCRNDTQFSAGYWRAANSCEKDGQLVPCANTTLINDTCQNIVLEIHNASTVHLVLKDLPLPSSVTQTFAEHYSAGIKPKCYYPGLPVMADKPLYFLNAGESGGCDTKPNLMKFGINTTIECLLKLPTWENGDGCPAVDRLRSIFLSNVSYICNCDRCEVPVLQKPSPVLNYNSTSCLIPYQATLTFTHANGFINGAHLSYGYRTIPSVGNGIPISVRIQFLEYHEPCQKSRFELQRGRFHCPSDTTCWKELWFPLKGLPSYTILQIGFAIIVLLFSISVVKRNQPICNKCDCQIVISRL